MNKKMIVALIFFVISTINSNNEEARGFIARLNYILGGLSLKAEAPKIAKREDLLAQIRVGLKLKPAADRVLEEAIDKKKVDIDKAIENVKEILQIDTKFDFLKDIASAQKERILERSIQKVHQLAQRRLNAIQLQGFDDIQRNIENFDGKIGKQIALIHQLKNAPLTSKKISAQVKNKKFLKIIKDLKTKKGRLIGKEFRDIKDLEQITSSELNLPTIKEYLTAIFNNINKIIAALKEPLGVESSKNLFDMILLVNNSKKILLDILILLSADLQIPESRIDYVKELKKSPLLFRSIQSILQIYHIVKPVLKLNKHLTALEDQVIKRAIAFKSDSDKWDSKIARTYIKRFLNKYKNSEYSKENELYYTGVINKLISELPDVRNLPNQFETVRRIRDNYLKPLAKMIDFYHVNSAIKQFKNILNSYSKVRKEYEDLEKQCDDIALTYKERKKCKKMLEAMAEKLAQSAVQLDKALAIEMETQRYLRTEIEKAKNNLISEISESNLGNRMKKEWQEKIEMLVIIALGSYDEKKSEREYKFAVPSSIAEILLNKIKELQNK